MKPGPLRTWAAINLQSQHHYQPGTSRLSPRQTDLGAERNGAISPEGRPAARPIVHARSRGLESVTVPRPIATLAPPGAGSAGGEKAKVFTQPRPTTPDGRSRCQPGSLQCSRKFVRVRFHEEAARVETAHRNGPVSLRRSSQGADRGRAEAASSAHRRSRAAVPPPACSGRRSDGAL